MPGVCLRLIWGRGDGERNLSAKLLLPVQGAEARALVCLCWKMNYRWLRCSSSFPRPKPKVAGGDPLQLGTSFASIMEICCRTENAPLSGLVMSLWKCLVEVCWELPTTLPPTRACADGSAALVPLRMRDAREAAEPALEPERGAERAAARRGTRPQSDCKQLGLCLR